MNKEEDLFALWGLTLIIRRLISIIIEENNSK